MGSTRKAIWPCGSCKIRQLKCDRNLPTCKRCKEAKRVCSGFKEDSPTVKSEPNSPKLGHDSKLPPRYREIRSADEITQPPVSRPLAPNNEQLVLGSFFNLWIPTAHQPADQPQFLGTIKPLFSRSGPGSPLTAATTSISWLVSAADRFKPMRIRQGERQYAKSLALLQDKLKESGSMPQNELILSVLLMGLIEGGVDDFILTDQARSNNPGYTHTHGAVLLFNKLGSRARNDETSLLLLSQLIERLTFNSPSLILELRDDICDGASEEGLEQYLHPVIASRVYEGLATYSLYKEVHRIIRNKTLVGYQKIAPVRDVLSRCQKLDSLLSSRLLDPSSNLPRIPINAHAMRLSNSRRSHRMLLHSVILQCVDALHAADPSLLNDIRLADTAATSICVLRDMALEVIDTVPTNVLEAEETLGPMFRHAEEPMGLDNVARYLVLGPLCTAFRAPALSHMIRRNLKEAILAVIGSTVEEEGKLDMALDEMDREVPRSEYLEDHPQLLA